MLLLLLLLLLLPPAVPHKRGEPVQALRPPHAAVVQRPKEVHRSGGEDGAAAGVSDCGGAAPCPAAAATAQAGMVAAAVLHLGVPFQHHSDVQQL